ncbi:hypothetical protein DsansV1_C18g0154181 [Dioscorea sansibarensis]
MLFFTNSSTEGCSILLVLITHALHPSLANKKPFMVALAAFSSREPSFSYIWEFSSFSTYFAAPAETFEVLTFFFFFFLSILG